MSNPYTPEEAYHAIMSRKTIDTYTREVMGGLALNRVGPQQLEALLDAIGLHRYVKHVTCFRTNTETPLYYFLKYSHIFARGWDEPVHQDLDEAVAVVRKIIPRATDDDLVYCLHIWDRPVTKDIIAELGKRGTYIPYAALLECHYNSVLEDMEVCRAIFGIYEAAGGRLTDKQRLELVLLAIDSCSNPELIEYLESR